MRTVNSYQANNHCFRLIDAAHADKTINWRKPQPGRQPGVLHGRVCLPGPEVLMAPLPEEELQALEISSLP